MADQDLCICGHYEEDHHRSWFWGGHMVVEECEFEGYNETGGMKYDQCTGRWLEHCQKFQQAEYNELNGQIGGENDQR